MRVASESLHEEYLRELVREYDSHGYFVRFSRLEYATRKAGFYGFDIASVPDPPKTDDDRLIAQALNRDWQGNHADMFALYNLALRLGLWLDSAASRQPRARLVQRVNDAFGPFFVPTLLNHWQVACRLKNAARKEQYFPKHYGLLDPAYRSLVGELLGDLIDRRVIPDEKARAYSDVHERVESHLAQVADFAGAETQS